MNGKQLAAWSFFLTDMSGDFILFFIQREAEMGAAARLGGTAVELSTLRD